MRSRQIQQRRRRRVFTFGQALEQGSRQPWNRGWFLDSAGPRAGRKPRPRADTPTLCLSVTRNPDSSARRIRDGSPGLPASARAPVHDGEATPRDVPGDSKLLVALDASVLADYVEERRVALEDSANGVLAATAAATRCIAAPEGWRLRPQIEVTGRARRSPLASPRWWRAPRGRRRCTSSPPPGPSRSGGSSRGSGSNRGRAGGNPRRCPR
jgi:hypothetical protein